MATGPAAWLHTRRPTGHTCALKLSSATYLLGLLWSLPMVRASFCCCQEDLRWQQPHPVWTPAALPTPQCLRGERPRAHLCTLLICTGNRVTTSLIGQASKCTSWGRGRGCAGACCCPWAIPAVHRLQEGDKLEMEGKLGRGGARWAWVQMPESG